MTATTVTQAYGTLLKGYFSASYDLVGRRVTLNGPGFKINVKPITNHDSPNGKAEYAPTGISDIDKISGQIWFVPTDASCQAMYDLWSTPRVINWQLTFTSGTTYQFAGILEEFKIGGMDTEGFLTADFSIQGSGDVTVTQS